MANKRALLKSGATAGRPKTTEPTPATAGTSTKAAPRKTQRRSILSEKTEATGRTYKNVSFSLLADDVGYLDQLAELVKSEGVAINTRSIVARAAVNALRQALKTVKKDDQAREIIKLSKPAK